MKKKGEKLVLRGKEKGLRKSPKNGGLIKRVMKKLIKSYEKL